MAEGHKGKNFIPSQEVIISFPSSVVRIYSITRGKNFILTHPLGKELYSYEALLIDQCSVKLGVKNCVQLIAKNTNFSDVKFTEKYNILHEIEAIISSQIVKIS